jgi:tRNA A37 threonylcarbamoyladenosine modification protein TsaB
MKSIQFIPISLLVTLAAILSIPAIAYGSFHYMYPADPDAVYTNHGNLNMVWHKFSQNENFTEYLARDTAFDEDSLTVDILVLRR